ncbi:hypothetical protein Tco_1402997 [Tanacetum coccineum]
MIRSYFVTETTECGDRLSRAPSDWAPYSKYRMQDDYKVVMAICQHGMDFALVRILSLKSNIWKDFGQVYYRFDDSTLAAKEEFREIPQPNDTRYVWNLGYTLGIIQGRLCIFPAFDEEFYPSCGIWVMKSYNSWELFPNGCEMKDHAIHYMLKDSNEYRITPPTAYFCDENIHLSRSKEHIPSPMFLPSLVSPYVSNDCGPSHAKNNKKSTFVMRIYTSLGRSSNSLWLDEKG